MAYFEWGPDLEIDHGLIDADHRQLVELVNELHTATSQGQGQEVVASVMERLITYTRQHFAREEQGMEAAAFPGLAAHREKHRAITAQLQALADRQAAGSITVASQLSSLLRDWLSLHIRRSDRELVAFLKAKKRAS
ncbi:MAG: bacteriohemerythrin [Burkholderiaceae bacterium]|nr:bacteriohemerythrin [Burkholderiaceae bacterium]